MKLVADEMKDEDDGWFHLCEAKTSLYEELKAEPMWCNGSRKRNTSVPLAGLMC
jgi:hypothetical protein